MRHHCTNSSLMHEPCEIICVAKPGGLMEHMDMSHSLKGLGFRVLGFSLNGLGFRV